MSASFKKMLRHTALFCTTPLMLFVTSCASKKIEDYTWIGEPGSFVVSYDTYDRESIPYNETLSTYANNANVEEMLRQDLACCICNNESLMQYSNIQLDLHFYSFSKQSHRLSVYWKVASDGKPIYEMEITNLCIVPSIDNNDNSFYFLPSNITIESSTIIVNPSFWITDSLFKILVNDYTTNKTYEFSYRQQDQSEQFIFKETFACFFILQPFYYSNTIIEK